MDATQTQWAGVPFLRVGRHDGVRIRAPGLYGFVTTAASGDRMLLYVDQAECIATVAHPAHPLWSDALRLGMDEVHVCLRAKARIDRLILRQHIIKRAEPILNLLMEAREPSGEIGLRPKLEAGPNVLAPSRQVHRGQL